jgi:hypothetical protein
MSDDTTRDANGTGPADEHGPEQPPAPEAGEQQLRKVLATMNDLEPPRDDLFVQRAIIRGRARTSRRRSTVLGAAAALVVIGAVGGTWVVANQGSSPSTASAGSAAADKEAPVSGQNSGARGPESLQGDGGGVGPSVPSSRDTTRWFGGLTTPQTAAFATVEPTLVARWPGIFSGAYATDAAGAHVTVAVTRHDPGLEALVTAAMPSPGDVEFVVVDNSYAEKQKIAQEIMAERMLWRSKGVEILGVVLDGRSDSVVVMADEGTAPGLLVREYGDVVRVVPSVAGTTPKLPNGSTLPTLQR